MSSPVDPPTPKVNKNKPLTLEECMQARSEFRPLPSMSPEAHKILMGHMDQEIERLKLKKGHTLKD
jgi:hypothetical protein